MPGLKTVRVKKIEDLAKTKGQTEELVLSEIEGRTYFVEENNSFYKDIRSTRLAISQLYFAFGNIPDDQSVDEKNLLELTNSLIIHFAPLQGGGEDDKNLVLYTYDEKGQRRRVQFDADSIPDAYATKQWVKDNAAKTAGSTNSNNDLFIIGATTQNNDGDVYPQTYSNINVKISNGTIYIDEDEVATKNWFNRSLIMSKLYKGINNATVDLSSEGTTQNYSVLIGAGAALSGSHSVAVGRSSQAAASTISLGYAAKANAINSIAIGESAEIGPSYTNSIAIGYQTTATASNQVRLGGNNSTITGYLGNKLIATQDYVTTMIGGISVGDTNVQSNWNELSSLSDAYIENKPTDLIRQVSLSGSTLTIEVI